jgi:hypothetical protein
MHTVSLRSRTRLRRLPLCLAVLALGACPATRSNLYQQHQTALEREGAQLAAEQKALVERFRIFRAMLTPDQDAKLKMHLAFKGEASKADFLSSLAPSQRDEFSSILIEGRNLLSAKANLKAKAQQLAQEEQVEEDRRQQQQIQSLGLLLQLQQLQVEQQRALAPQRTSCTPNIFGGFDCTSN